MNDYYPRLICKIDKVCIRLRIIIAFKTTITIPVLKSLFLFGKLAPPLYLYLHFYPANPPPPSRECVVKRPKLAPPAPGRIPPRQDTPPMVKKETRCNITRFVYNTFSRELSASHEYLTTKAVGLSFYNQGEDSVCSHFRNFAPPLDEKGGIITEKVFPVFSERVFWACFGLVI